MKTEQKKALGYLIQRYRTRRNWTQEDLEARSDVNLRTIQRVEGGEGIGTENLNAIAEALNMDAGELRIQAETASSPPEKRISLKQVKSAKSLLDVLERCSKRGWTLGVGPPDEHPYNEMIGEDLIGLSNELDEAPNSDQERVLNLRCAQFIVSMCQQMGFGLFAGNYVENVKIKKRSQRRRATLVLAAPLSDQRIVKTRTGMELDVVRDSRRLLLGGLLSGHTTTYDWLEHQLISKSDGEERVKDAFRRIMTEVMAEINQLEKPASAVPAPTSS